VKEVNSDRRLTPAINSRAPPGSGAENLCGPIDRKKSGEQFVKLVVSASRANGRQLKPRLD
jgi:hypothetical protein